MCLSKIHIRDLFPRSPLGKHSWPRLCWAALGHHSLKTPTTGRPKHQRPSRQPRSGTQPQLVCKYRTCQPCLGWNTTKSQLQLTRLHQAEMKKSVKWNSGSNWGKRKTGFFPLFFFPFFPPEHITLKKLRKEKPRVFKENFKEYANQWKRKRIKRRRTVGTVFSRRCLLSPASAPAEMEEPRHYRWIRSLSLQCERSAVPTSPNFTFPVALQWMPGIFSFTFNLLMKKKPKQSCPPKKQDTF